MTHAASPEGAPSPQHVGMAIIGTGFAGLGAAIRLRQAGFHDLVLFERADDVGGTWRDNHYPGLCCDVPSHVYSFSFELNPFWKRGFAPGAEILDYLRNTANKYGITPLIRFGHEVLEARWNDQSSRWEIETTGGSLTAQFLINGAGALSDPATPAIPGVGSFRGTAFHSAHWNHRHDLRGERVAVIGTGASAIQFIPQIQPDVARLYVFQRTPPWVIPRLDHEITRTEHRLLRWIPFAPHIVRFLLYWLLEVRVIGFKRPRVMKVAEAVARWHLRRQIRDPDLQRKLTPDYTIGCKRILISDDYYPALGQPNVDVVTDGIQEIRPRSIVTADGTEREIDTIIFGTGFHVTDPPIAERIRGRDGRTLAEHWKGGLQAYLGTTVKGFPNLFLMTGPNTGLGHNSMVFMIESQLNYVLGCLRTMRERRAAVVEVRSEVQDLYNERIQEAMEGTVWTAGHCHSWYLDDTGRNSTLWPTYSYSYRRLMRRFDHEAYTFRTRTEVATPARAGAVVSVRSPDWSE
ncbi:MAG: flavin-containing monooxygenase [Actinomycetota bacterium]